MKERTCTRCLTTCRETEEFFFEIPKHSGRFGPVCRKCRSEAIKYGIRKGQRETEQLMRDLAKATDGLSGNRK